MLNPQKLQETIEVCRRILSDRAQFDRAERDYKLEIAGNIAGALQAVKAGADLDEPLKKAFGKPNNLTSWRTNGVFRQWAGEHPEQARRALEPFTRPDLPVEGRVDRFFAEFPESVVSGLGMRLMLASFFSFGSDPTRLVQYRSSAFKMAEPLLGWPVPARDLSPGATYRHHLAFVQQLETELREAGLEIRDTLDAQSLLWWLTKSDHADCVRWRGESAAGTRAEETRERSAPSRPSAELEALVDRFVTRCAYPSPAQEADLTARQEFAAILAEDALEILDWDRLKAIASTGKYGAPGPQSGFNRYINQVGDEGRERLRDSIRHLLYADEPLERRLDDLLDGDYRVPGFGESLATKFLSIVDDERVLPIFVTSGAKGKLALMRHTALALPTSVEGTRGERAVRTNDLLRERLEPFFGGDTYGMKEFLYWLNEQQGEEGEDEAERIAALAERLFVDAAWLEEVIELLRERKQLIFYGPPGTGKTYIAREIMRFLAKEESRRSVVQFHPNYSYEDFVHGYRPTTREDGALSYELKPGPLVRLADAAREAGRGSEHVMIIDEINRGNLPKIFGELLYLLEYRDDEITLMYGEEGVPFALPENLLIIGTMNTADRSVALVDAALRRRFHFVPLFPGESPLEGFLEQWLEAHHPEMRWVAGVVDRLNEKLRDRFGPHLQLGHSHFVKSDLTNQALERIWRYDVMPFLEDQLFGQEEELALFTLDALRHEPTSDDPAEGVPADA